jgi:hypothetical protein
MDTATLTELLHLMGWQASASQRLGWLTEQLAVGPTEGGHRALPTPAAPAGAPAARGGGGSLLLAAGALLLVLAGIAFLAFTWRLLGPFGQISTLLLLGAGCLTAAIRLLGRLRGTATALGLVGVFLISIAALGTRVLGPDVIGETGSLVVAVLMLMALGGAAIWVRPHSAPIGEIAAVASAVLVIALLATAPLNDALPLDEPWTWWSAGICLAGGVGLLVTADRFGLASWPWVAACYLVVGSITAAAYMQLLTSDAVAPELEVVIFASTLVIAAVLVAVMLRRTAHPWPVTIAAVTLWSVAVLIAWSSALSTAGERPYAAMALAAAGVVGVLPRLLVLRESWLGDAVTFVGLAVVGSAVGLVVAPWLDPHDDPQGAEPWAAVAWPAWRGLVAGIAFVAVLAASVVAVPRLKRAASAHVTTLTSIAVMVPPAAALGTWLIATQNDVATATTSLIGPFEQPTPTPDAVVHQVAIALGVLSLGLLTTALLRRTAAWSVWFVPALALPAVLLELSTRTFDGSWQPELYGLALAAPTAFAAYSWWWLRRPSRTPTWQTIAPVFIVAVGPSTLALLEDTSSRWWYGDDPGTAYQVRMVALLAVGVASAVVGARQRWGGLFAPGLLLVGVVVVIELVDLGRFLPQWVSFGIAGALLITAGARWEWVRTQGHEGAAWVRRLR